jgi:hypothetical protein
MKWCHIFFIVHGTFIANVPYVKKGWKGCNIPSEKNEMVILIFNHDEEWDDESHHN